MLKAMAGGPVIGAETDEEADEAKFAKEEVKEKSHGQKSSKIFDSLRPRKSKG